nr:UvrD-helicase domain-containing protein [Micromonospora sp. DSM 115978]
MSTVEQSRPADRAAAGRARRRPPESQPFLPGFDDDELFGLPNAELRAGRDGLRPGPALRPEDLRTLLDVPFTDEQLAAAAAPTEPAVIVAGAGSGKTSVMAARVVWLVATGAVAPDRVLGLTFTSKAAAELSARIGSALGRVRQAGALPAVAAGADTVGGHQDDAVGDPVVCTYHAFAGRLVTEHALRLGLEPDAKVLAAAARYQLAARVVRGYSGRVSALTKTTSAVVGDLVALDGEMSEHLLSPADVEAFEAAWLARLAAVIEAADGRRGTKTLVRELRTMMAASRGRRVLARLVERYAAAR